jgi:hypothetical protein
MDKFTPKKDKSWANRLFFATPDNRWFSAIYKIYGRQVSIGFRLQRAKHGCADLT